MGKIDFRMKRLDKYAFEKKNYFFRAKPNRLKLIQTTTPHREKPLKELRKGTGKTSR